MSSIFASSRLSPPELDGLALIGLAAIATTFMLEATRVFLSTMIFVVDQSNRATIGVNVAATYLLAAVAIPLFRLLGRRRTIIVAALLLVLSRFAFQLIDDPTARFRFAQVTVIAWSWLILALVLPNRIEVARGLVLGFILDIALRYGTVTIDLPWMPSPGKTTVVLLLTATLLAALSRITRREPGHALIAPTVPLLAVGPAIALFHLASGNLGLAIVKSEFPPSFMPIVLAIGCFAALSVRVPRASPEIDPRRVAIGYVLGLVAIAALSLWLFWNLDGIVDVLIGVTSGLVSGLLILAVGTTAGTRGASSTLASGLWLTAGLVIQAIVLFAYFSATGQPILIGVLLLVLGAGALVAVRNGEQPFPAGRPVKYATFAVAGAMFLALLVGADGWRNVKAQGPLGNDITVVSYNIQSGFSRENDWDLERTARVIEDAGADIVILQEVTRGWIVTTGVDQLTWLGQRLGMEAVWGSSSRDGQWGVAILSTAPLHDETMTIYQVTTNLRRGVLSASVETVNGGFLVFATHLDNPAAADEVRMGQTEELLGEWNGRTPAIVGGDFNADPSSDVVAAMVAAGFTDSGAVLGRDASTSEGGRRIDYIFVTAPIVIRSADVPNVWASDHRPMVADLTLSP